MSRVINNLISRRLVIASRVVQILSAIHTTTHKASIRENKRSGKRAIREESKECRKRTKCAHSACKSCKTATTNFSLSYARPMKSISTSGSTTIN